MFTAYIQRDRTLSVTQRAWTSVCCDTAVLFGFFLQNVILADAYVSIFCFNFHSRLGIIDHCYRGRVPYFCPPYLTGPGGVAAGCPRGVQLPLAN